MNNTANLFRLAVIFVAVMTLQVVVFDNMDFLGLCNPFIYIIFIMRVPLGCPNILLMLMAAVAGLVVDLASNTPGMHMMACVLIARLRPFLLRLISFRNAPYKEGEMPDARTYGTLWFLRYTLLMVSVHHVTLFLVEQFDSFFLWPTLARIALSIVASTAIIMLVETFAPRFSSAAED